MSRYFDKLREEGWTRSEVILPNDELAPYFVLDLPDEIALVERWKLPPRERDVADGALHMTWAEPWTTSIMWTPPKETR